MIGKRLAHYTVVERLGAGGMGEVYHARDEHLDREVAIKVLPEAFSDDEKRVARFHREAKLASHVSHPNVATVFDSNRVDGQHFIVMELVKGETLASRVKPGGLSLDQILAIAIPLAEGLAEAHRAGVVHRDLKPGNVMIDHRGRVKILDFGLSRPLPESDLTAAGLTSSGVILGTPHYMAPEQMRGEEMDARSDLFSLGVILYELATGVRPFEGDSLAAVMKSVLDRQPPSIMAVNPHVGELFAHTVERLLEKDPAHRVQHASDLAEELKSLKKPTTTIVIPTRRRALPFALGITAIALVAVYALRPTTRVPSGAEEPLGATGPGSDDVTLAIVPFTVPEGDEEAQTIARTLVHCLPEVLDASKIDLLTARFLGDRAKRRGIEPDALDSETGRDIAKEAGASVMLVGQVERAPSGLDIHCELLEVGTGRHRATKNLFAVRLEEVRGYVEELADTILPSLGVAEHEQPEPVSLSDSPRALEAWARGLVAYDAADWVEADRFFERAVTIDPDFALAHYHRSKALWWLLENEDLSLAHDAGEEALRSSERLSARDHEKVEVFLTILDEYPNVVTAGLLQRARDLAASDPRDKDALDLWMEVAFHHVGEGSRPETIVACKRLIELDPEYAPAHIHLLLAGRSEDLLRSAARGIVAHAPESDMLPRALVVLGEIEQARSVVGDRERHRTAAHRREASVVAILLGEYELALELTSGDPEGSPTALTALGRFEAARDLVNAGMAAPIERVELGIVPPSPNNLESRLCKAVALARGGKIDSAEGMLGEIYEAALAEPEIRPLALWARAEIQLARGATDEALWGMLKAVPEPGELNVFGGVLLERAAGFLVEMGRYDEAEVLLDRIEKDFLLVGPIRPEWWVVPRIRSWLYRAICRDEEGDIDGALAYLKKFLKYWYEPDEAFPEIEDALDMYAFLTGEEYVPGEAPQSRPARGK